MKILFLKKKSITQRLWRNNNLFFLLMYNGGMPSHSILVRRHKNTRHIKKKNKQTNVSLSLLHILAVTSIHKYFFCTDQDNFMSALKKYRQHKHHRQRSSGGSRCWFTHSESVHNHDQIQFISRFEILPLRFFFSFCPKSTKFATIPCIWCSYPSLV